MTHASIEVSSHIIVTGPAIVKDGVIAGVTSEGKQFFGKVIHAWKVVK